MTTELRSLVNLLTCRRCQGEGVLHSHATRYAGEGWETHLACDLCLGSGVNPMALRLTPEMLLREGSRDV